MLLKAKICVSRWIALSNSGHLKNLKAIDFSNYDSDFFEYDVAKVIKAIDKGCPNLKTQTLWTFVRIEFDNGRIVCCNECEVYHLKKQNSFESKKCPHKHKERNVSKTACTCTF